MMRKALGYVLAIVGLGSLAIASFPAVLASVPFSIPPEFTKNTLTIAGLALVVVGSLIAFQGRGAKQAKEVPIYQGKNIVGYRRQK